MKKADVKIGGKYYANVSGNRCEIQIDAEKPRGGWDATNLATGKKIHIKSAQRLQGVVGTRRGRAKVSSPASEVAVENKPAIDATIGVETIAGESTPVVTVLKKNRKAKASHEATADAGEARLSCIAAALKVLGESREPLNTVEMIKAMETKGYWKSPGGKTPHATLYSAILRDLAKGDAAHFVKTERGRFAAKA